MLGFVAVLLTTVVSVVGSPPVPGRADTPMLPTIMQAAISLEFYVHLPLIIRSEPEPMPIPPTAAPPPTVAPPPTLTPTVPPPVCSCHANTYNCSDFPTQAYAQTCYQYCISQGAGDVHQLDADNDGSACEALP